MDGETEGILQVGELPVIRRRERVISGDHSQAFRSGAEKAYGEMLEYANAKLAAVPPYEDTRPWGEMILFLRDRIKDNGATS
jgi:hypothetical protein